MAEHDYDLANQDGASFRADLNNALAAVVGLNSKATAPTTTFAYMLWMDTTAAVLKQRNSANSAWVTLWDPAGGVFGQVSVIGNWLKPQQGAITTLTDAATVAIDFADSNNYKLTIAGNRTLGQPSSQVAGQSGSITITQDGTGSRTLAYHADWKFAGGTAPTLTTTAGAKDRLDYYVVAANEVHAVLTNDVK